MIDIQNNFTEFMSSMDARLLDSGLDLRKYPLDHIGFRVADMSDYHSYMQYWKAQSVIMSTKQFHERSFHMFMLKAPLEYLDVSVYTVEFTEPGGSDNYDTGFQHIEILTPLAFSDLFPKREVISRFFFEGKHKDETYLKWEDKSVLKLRNKPITFMATAEDGPVIEVL